MKISIVVQTALVGTLLITGAMFSPAVGSNTTLGGGVANQSKDTYRMDAQNISPERAKALCDSYQTWVRSLTANQRLGEQILSAPIPASKSREWIAGLPKDEAALLDQNLTALMQKDGDHLYVTHVHAAIVAPLCERGGEKVDKKMTTGY